MEEVRQRIRRRRYRSSLEASQADPEPRAQRQLKPLVAIVTAPTIRPDGSVLAAPGYDRSTSLLVHLENEIIDVPQAPGNEEVRRALAEIMLPFEEFPLVDDLARGGLLAALLTAVVRPALATAPAFAMDAPVQGAGKTLLASCVAALATGEIPEIWPHTSGRDDEETRKSAVHGSARRQHGPDLGQCHGILDSAALASAITAPVLRDRVLGRSASVGIPNRALLLLTGINFCPAGDLSRRMITIRIDPETDAPFARKFDLAPLDYVLDHRMELARAAIVLIRGWLSSGAAPAEGRMASFEDWDDLVRQTVCWIGRAIAPGQFGDPLDLVRRAQGSDPEQESLFALLEALDEVFGSAGFTAGEVRQRAARARTDHLAPGYEKALAEALSDAGGERSFSSTRTVGRVLRNRVGRITYGLRLRSRAGRSGFEYRVETVGTIRRCGFSGFSGFESGHSELGAQPTCDSDRAETNPLNPLNSQTVDTDVPEDR